jgi:hypothetical protein
MLDAPFGVRTIRHRPGRAAIAAASTRSVPARPQALGEDGRCTLMYALITTGEVAAGRGIVDG